MTTPTARQAAHALLRDHDIRYLLAQFVDIHGVAKTKIVPAAHLDLILDGGAGFSGYAIGSMGIARNGGDYFAVGDLDTLQVLPWLPGHARIVGDGHVHGEPHPVCSRVVLKTQLARIAARGWVFNTGLEPEFTLLRKTATGIVPADADDTLAMPSYDFKCMARPANLEFLERVSAAMQASGADVYQIDHEDCASQYEINYAYADALTSADRYILFKMAAGHIARDLGMLCSFMPKPFADRAGNGLHFHLSIADETGRNLFDDDTDARGLDLSPLAYHFLAGLLAHAPALTALCAPTVNSYKRLVVGGSRSGATWAPAWITYGDNRTMLARVPGRRIEWRLADAGANPYLVAAGLIAAGLDGIERHLHPGEPLRDDLYGWSAGAIERAGLKHVPQQLGEAIDALDADTVLRDALGAAFVNEFVRVKREEWDEYSRQVSDWEVARYVAFF